MKINQHIPIKNWSNYIIFKRILWFPFSLIIVLLPGRSIFGLLKINILKLFGAKISGVPLILSGVKIWFPWNLEIGMHSAIGKNVELYNFAPIKIGEQVTISQYSYICTASHDYTNPLMPLIYKPITINSQTWVASCVFISPGVVIGEGVVIAACSVVTRDIPPWVVVAGNPAKFIKKRTVI